MFLDVSNERGHAIRMVIFGVVEIHKRTIWASTIRKQGKIVLQEIITDFCLQMLKKLRPFKEEVNCFCHLKK